MKKGDKKPKDTPPESETTIRANVSRDEHAAIRHICKAKLGGMTIDQFVRTAVVEKLDAVAGKSLEQLAEEARDRGKLVQGDLFNG